MGWVRSGDYMVAVLGGFNHKDAKGTKGFYHRGHRGHRVSYLEFLLEFLL